MTITSLLSCPLDRADVPDLSDLSPVDVDLDRVAGVSFHVSTARGPSGSPDYYPFALLELDDRLIAIPLEPARELIVAEAAIELLRAALDPARN